MSRETKEFKIKVPGTDFVLKSNTLYTVLPKPDDNAPDGFKEHGTTKIIHPAVSNTVQCPWDIDLGVWDTGFYENSPCLREMDEDEEIKFIENIRKVLVSPVERIKGKDSLHHSSDNAFFDDFVVTLYNKETFNTADPLQLLGLYLAILGKELAPKENAGHPAFREAAYMVVNRDKEISVKAEKSIEKSKAIGKFYKLLHSDKKKLSILLSYLDIATTAINDEDVFLEVFTRYLEDKQDGYRNASIFLKTLERFSGKKEEELYIFDNLRTLLSKGDVKIFKQELFLEDINLGASLKHAASYVMLNKDIKERIMTLITSAEEDE